MNGLENVPGTTRTAHTLQRLMLLNSYSNDDDDNKLMV
jgi:hypothetical protein